MVFEVNKLSLRVNTLSSKCVLTKKSTCYEEILDFVDAIAIARIDFCR